MCLIPAFGIYGPYMRRMATGVYATNCVEEAMMEHKTENLSRWVKWVTVTKDGKEGSRFEFYTPPPENPAFRKPMFYGDGQFLGFTTTLAGECAVISVHNPEVLLKIDPEYAALHHLHEMKLDGTQLLQEAIIDGYRYRCTGCCFFEYR